jgi:hypothetical protein
MSEVVPLPVGSEVLPDARGEGRVLRVTWHGGLAVLSLWRYDRCQATFRLPAADVPALVAVLVEGLATAAPSLPHAAGER